MEPRLSNVIWASGLAALACGILGITLAGEVPSPADPTAHLAAVTETVLDATAEPLPPAIETAAAALRERRCADAQRELAPVIHSEDVSLRRRGLLVSGFYAHACEDVQLAVARLGAAAQPGGRLEDWRLLLLAQSASATGDRTTSRDALTRLLSDYRDSPLWERALVTAVEQAAGTGETGRLMELVGWSREQEGLSNPTIARLETAAWETAKRNGDLAAQAQAGRRLLAYAPITAGTLEAVELFRRDGGEVPWNAILTPAEIEIRSQALISAGFSQNAIQTLERVAPADRGLSWTLAFTSALVRENRAREALDALARVTPTDVEERTRLEWARALATADLARPLGSGAALSVAEREQMSEISHQHMARVVRLGADRDLARQALRRLYEDYATDGRFELAVEALRGLRRLDPADTTGAGHLWNLGWQQFQRANHTGAVGYWSELWALYPESREARSGRYWTGRAFERMGNAARARSVFREIAASDTTDFYRKHALTLLLPAGEAVPATAMEPPREQPWPLDPRLDRARLLTDLGLDDLALTEIEAQGDGLEPRARNALTGLAFARQGRYRAGIPHLRRAFPALGGPHQASLPAQARYLYYPLAFQDEIRPAAELSGVSPHLVYGIIREESAFDVTALSHVGARGLMQLMPGTGREIAGKLGLPYTNAKLDEPAFNVRLGSAYFGQLMRMFDGNTELALAGYNGGPYRMKRLWQEAGPAAEMDYFLETLPIEESRNYVKRVIVFSNSYQDLYGL